MTNVAKLLMRPANPREPKGKAKSASDLPKTIVSVMLDCMYVCSLGCLTVISLIHKCRLKLLPTDRTRSKYGKRAHMMMLKMVP